MKPKDFKSKFVKVISNQGYVYDEAESCVGQTLCKENTVFYVKRIAVKHKGYHTFEVIDQEMKKKYVDIDFNESDFEIIE